MTILNKTLWSIALASLLSLSASADVLTVNVDGVTSWDLEGDPDNTIILVDLGAGAIIDGVGWDVTIETVGASWLSEATFSWGPQGGPAELLVTPGFADGVPGSMSYDSGGIIDLSDNAIPDIVLADGILQIEFFESFDDVTDAVDANWFGSLFVSCTGSNTCDGIVGAAEPGILVLFGLGLVGVVVARRRKV